MNQWSSKGFCSFPHARATLPLANAACLVARAYAFGGALPYVTSRAFHPTAKVSTPMDGGIPVCLVKAINYQLSTKLCLLDVHTIE